MPSNELLSDVEHEANRKRGAYVCQCATPNRDSIGQCHWCYRLVTCTRCRYWRAEVGDLCGTCHDEVGS